MRQRDSDPDPHRCVLNYKHTHVHSGRRHRNRRNSIVPPSMCVAITSSRVVMHSCTHSSSVHGRSRCTPHAMYVVSSSNRFCLVCVYMYVVSIHRSGVPGCLSSPQRHAGQSDRGGGRSHACTSCCVYRHHDYRCSVLLHLLVFSCIWAHHTSPSRGATISVSFLIGTLHFEACMSHSHCVINVVQRCTVRIHVFHDMRAVSKQMKSHHVSSSNNVYVGESILVCVLSSIQYASKCN